MPRRSRRWKCPTRHSYAIWHRAQFVSLAGQRQAWSLTEQQFVISREQLEQIRALRAVPEPEQFMAREIVGHESAAVSRQYTHLTTDDKRAAMQRLPDVTNG